MSENPFTLEEVVKLSKLVRREREKNRSSTILWDLELKLFRLERDRISEMSSDDTSEDLCVSINPPGTSTLVAG